MSTRDELAKAREEILWAIGNHCSHEGKPLPEPAEPCPSCSQIATEVLNQFDLAARLLGYIKPDREEWGVILDDYGSTDMFDSESEAREDQKRNGGTVARFTVTEYPQEVA
ncbi:hypothetical protein GS539_19375 [Rhodococcus hoagii]|nr:hypothetical protein [Prescottella equi]